MAFGKGKHQGNNHEEHQLTEQAHETLRNLPTYNPCDARHTGWVKGPNNETQCRGCGKPRCEC